VRPPARPAPHSLAKISIHRDRHERGTDQERVDQLAHAADHNVVVVLGAKALRVCRVVLQRGYS
jgi:hypothetical protein